MIDNGVDFRCSETVAFGVKGVIVNRKDILSQQHTTTWVDFVLKAGLKGVPIFAKERKDVFCTFEKKEVDGLIQYSHLVHFKGVILSEELLNFLKNEEYADYFLAVSLGDRVIICGFDYSVKLEPYNFDLKSDTGVDFIFKTDNDALEDFPPRYFKKATEKNEAMHSFELDFYPQNEAYCFSNYVDPEYCITEEI